MSDSENKCKWCEKSFKTERTLIAHACPKKRRWADRDLTHVRLAFRVFQKFYEMSTSASKAKSQEDFINSQYYTGFTKFGRACVFNEWLNPENYAEWLIKNSIKLADWTKDSTYDKYLLEYVRKETGLRAMERTVLHMVSWGDESNIPWQDYFKRVSTSRAVYDIRACKVSPWVLYLSDTGDQLLTRFNDEQIKMIDHVIDANFWMAVFQKNAQEVDEVQDTCRAAGI
jgi:hypothetical protein